MAKPSAPPESRPFDYVRKWQRRLDDSGWWHSFELPDGRIIQGSCDLKGLKSRIAQFPIPEDLRGKRVLDIGAWDGWFSFEMERRGANVVAIDTWDNPRFRQMHQILNSRVEYLQLDVYDLDPRKIGKFDIVLFMGVLYHLKHPLLGLEKVCSVTDGMAAVDSFILREEYRPGADVANRPLMEFYETDELGGQTDNWVGPSVPCLLAFCRTAGFARAELQNVLEYSACVVGYRRWEDPEITQGEAPNLLSVFHHTNFGINFHSAKDEYMDCWFEYDSQSPPLTLENVKPQVAQYGVRPIHVDRVQGHWQAQFKCPPGLAPGWHDVTLRVNDSPAGNAAEIAVDLPLETTGISIVSTCDGTTWKPGAVDLTSGSALVMWVDGLPEAADRNNTRVTMSGVSSAVEYVERRKSGPRQVNVLVPPEARPGSVLTVSLTVAGLESPPVLVPCA